MNADVNFFKRANLLQVAFTFVVASLSYLLSLGESISGLFVVLGGFFFVIIVNILSKLLIAVIEQRKLRSVLLVVAKLVVVLGGTYLASRSGNSQVVGFITGVLLFLPAAACARLWKI